MDPRDRLTQAVIPAAGLGTRFLPATKAQAKEMIPVFDRPSIQLVVEEAVRAGITGIVMVTGHGKEAIRRHFAPDPRLERHLRSSGKAALAREVGRAGRLARFTYRFQPVPLGLGHAILCARTAVHAPFFAVMLPDDLVDSRIPAVSQLWRVHRRYGGSVIAVMRVPRSEVHHYGIVAGDTVGRGVLRIRAMVEKPSPGRAPSNYAVVGRYIISSTIFGILARAGSGKGGEIQLTDALRELSLREPVHACLFEGRRYDAGDKAGFVHATVAYAMKDRSVAHTLKRVLRGVR